ncbi:hypothetical protein C0991_009169 [Blastosporella zonata]|nr:hypothetical protein C0991_009169 [Blastosporella zonata]
MSYSSRIPQSVPKNSQKNDTEDVSRMHNTLLALGAPAISLDDFARLYHGPFGELLIFMSTQIKGRKQVARDRHLIQHYRDSRSKLPTRVPEDGATLEPVRRSMVELSTAQREAYALQAKLKESQAELEEARASYLCILLGVYNKKDCPCGALDSQVMDLRQILQEKRRAALMLGILEERERLTDKADYHMGLEIVEKRAWDLLTRKVEKAALGDSFLEDIDTLMKEVRTLVG